MPLSEPISESSSSYVTADYSRNEPTHATPLPLNTIKRIRTKQGAGRKRKQPKLSSSEKKSQGSTPKRLAASSSHDGVFERDDSGNDKTRRRLFSSETRLGCPFFKHDPTKYCKVRAFQTPGWPTMARVKEHIMRRHKEDMTASQIDSLQPRSSSKTDVERWIEVFDILFPEAQKPPTPYCSDPGLERTTTTRVNSEVLKLLHESLAQDSMFKGSPTLMKRIPEIVDECMASVLAKCQNPELSYPAPPSGDQGFMQWELDYQISLPEFGTEQSNVGCSAVGFDQHPVPLFNEPDFWELQTSSLSDFDWGAP